MPSSELKADFFGLSTSSNTAASASASSFLPPPPMPPPDLGDYTSSLSYGHMSMVNYFLFRIFFLLFICRIIQVVYHLHYVLLCIIHLKTHHVLVQQQLTENQMNKLKIYVCVVFMYSIKKNIFFS